LKYQIITIDRDLIRPANYLRRRDETANSYKPGNHLERFTSQRFGDRTSEHHSGTSPHHDIQRHKCSHLRSKLQPVRHYTRS
jgi:hypothetical protein